MAEYIEREAVLSEVDNAFKMFQEHDGIIELYSDVRAAIIYAKTADVDTVRHEKWKVIVGSDRKERMVCTGCRKQQDLTGVFSYCPNCGAKMDGGTQNEQS